MSESEEEQTEEKDQYDVWIKGLAIGFEIIIFAIIGYFIAGWLGWNQILGAALGAILGTFAMYIQLYRIYKKFSNEERER
ncbi:MAG: hypothetical protein ACTSQY_08370 [Candidatus Odinarchaeia archaeon]